MKLTRWILAAVLAGGCQAPSPYPVSAKIRAAYPSIGFGTVTRKPLSERNAKQLSVDDARQIVALGGSRADIRKPISAIYFTDDRRAEVTGGIARTSGDALTEFKVRKDNGRWKIIDGSIEQNRVIITP
jgi:hypothetical protein